MKGSQVELLAHTLSVRLATVVGWILVSNLALFSVRRGGSRPISPSCRSCGGSRNPTNHSIRIVSSIPRAQSPGRLIHTILCANPSLADSR